MRYNTGPETFSANMIAGAFKFSESQSFEIQKTEQREAPKVSFG